MARFEDLIGKTLVRVEGRDGGEEITFTADNGDVFKLMHHQDCCESVYVEDICGDLCDLVGNPIIVAAEVSQEDPCASESGTWTFYKLATIKGWVDIRFYGCSNGYYSESVDFVKVD